MCGILFLFLRNKQWYVGGVPREQRRSSRCAVNIRQAALVHSSCRSLHPFSGCVPNYQTRSIYVPLIAEQPRFPGKPGKCCPKTSARPTDPYPLPNPFTLLNIRYLLPPIPEEFLHGWGIGAQQAASIKKRDVLFITQRVVSSLMPARPVGP